MYNLGSNLRLGRIPSLIPFEIDVSYSQPQSDRLMRGLGRSQVRIGVSRMGNVFSSSANDRILRDARFKPDRYRGIEAHDNVAAAQKAVEAESPWLYVRTPMGPTQKSSHTIS